MSEFDINILYHRNVGNTGENQMTLINFLMNMFLSPEAQELCPEQYLICDDEYFNEYYNDYLEE